MACRSCVVVNDPLAASNVPYEWMNHLPGLVNIQKAMENGPVEIVSFPMNSMVDLSSSQTVSSPEGSIVIL